MKFFVNLILLLTTISTLHAQDIQHNVYMVTLTDKHNSPYSFFHPQDFLSFKSLERRAFQNIAIDERDLPINPVYLKKIVENGGEIINSSKWLNAVSVYLQDSNSINKIKELPFVSDIIKLGSKRYPKEFKLQDHFPHEDYKKSNNFYGATLNQIAMLGMHALQDIGQKGQNKTVAIFDGGFSNVYRMPAFDSLFAGNRILGTRDFVEGDEFVYEASTHGTQVLSCMAANLPFLVMGTAPGASYYLFKTEDVGSEFRIEEFNWVAAAEYADSLGVDIINSSLGYTTFNDPAMNYTYEDLTGQKGICSRGADIAVEKGMLVVNSAGNEGDGKWKYIGTPADGHNVISVGAVRANGSRASFSSFGPTPDGRLKPNVSAQGSRAVVAGMRGYSVTTTDGTSFSSPIMAGAITSLWSAFPDKTNWEIKDAVEAAGHQTTAPDSSLGYGIPNFLMSYLILQEDPTIIIAPEGRVFHSKKIVKNRLDLLIETDNSTTVNYSLMNKLNQNLFMGTAFLNKNEFKKFDIPLLSKLPKDIYILKIEIGGEKTYVEILKN